MRQTRRDWLKGSSAVAASLGLAGCAGIFGADETDDGTETPTDEPVTGTDQSGDGGSDLVATDGAGVTVVSGDELVVELAAGLGADRVGVCSTVPGVLDDDGTVVSRIESFEAVADVLGASESTDVSGGMATKVRELLALDSPAAVFGPDGLASFLRGDEPGTRIE